MVTSLSPRAHALGLGQLTSQTEEREKQEGGEAPVQGPRRVAVHFGILAGTHLYPEICDVRHGWLP